jgi:hypothetical protein
LMSKSKMALTAPSSEIMRVISRAHLMHETNPARSLSN